MKIETKEILPSCINYLPRGYSAYIYTWSRSKLPLKCKMQRNIYFKKYESNKVSAKYFSREALRFECRCCSSCCCCLCFMQIHVMSVIIYFTRLHCRCCCWGFTTYLASQRTVCTMHTAFFRISLSLFMLWHFIMQNAF